MEKYGDDEQRRQGGSPPGERSEGFSTGWQGADDPALASHGSPGLSETQPIVVPHAGA